MIATRHLIWMTSTVALMVFACKHDPTSNLADLDLLSHGMPIVIKAPVDPEIRKMDLVFMKDITVVKGDEYNIQIFESEATSRDLATIKARLMNEVKINPYFVAILQDDAAGFIYESRVDSSYTNYGFRHVRIQGDKEYTFQQGLRGKFAREAIETMYAAVQ